MSDRRDKIADILTEAFWKDGVTRQIAIDEIEALLAPDLERLQEAQEQIKENQNKLAGMAIRSDTTEDVLYTMLVKLHCILLPQESDPVMEALVLINDLKSDFSVKTSYSEVIRRLDEIEDLLERLKKESK